MEKIQGYQELDKIYESSRSLLYRAVEEKSKQPVILKILNKENPTPEDTSKFKREYELTGTFEDEGIVEILELLEVDDSLALIMKDIGGESLANILALDRLRLDEFLVLAIELAAILGNIHKRKIIHKDINPSNIIWNRQKNIVKIIDFGIATLLPRELASLEIPHHLEGTLAYISPEQTGRINRCLDYRTDFYSLGVTFYWMLTGTVPFESDELLEIVHSHIAKSPMAPHERDITIPEAVSAIVMKLMSKDADNRYQSALGLTADLTECLKQWRNTGAIKPFKLAAQDVSDRFQIPQKLYGREAELEQLLAAFERVRHGAKELTLVTGRAGIGKSILIHEIQGAIAKHNGYFVSGKFERLKKNVPYSAIMMAFVDLARRIIAEGEASIENKRKQLLDVLGPNGKIITDVLPLFEVILGVQPDVPELGPQQSQNRFNLVFQNFVRTLAAERQPLVLFFDDLQWADLGSLHLLKLFTTASDIEHLYVIGAYRHNEVSDAHPLTLTLKEIEKSQVTLHSIFLEPLKKEHVKQLLDDTLNNPKQDTRELTELVVRKTKGNPFFVHEFLKSLYKESLIDFSVEKRWHWDMGGIEAMRVTDNVVELMVKKIIDLSEPAQDLLKLGACIGSYFDLPTLVTVSGKPDGQISRALDEVLQEGMLSKTDEVYRFAHERIQEASYSLISEEEKIERHYRIGNLVWHNTSEEELKEKIFYIANQMNSAAERVQGSAEKRKLAELNCMAGKKALVSNAYTSALAYIQMGIGLINQNEWETDYEFALKLYELGTSAAQLSADYSTMEKLAKEVMHHARDVLDTIKTYETKIFACQAKSELLDATKIGLTVLGKLGLSLPEKPSKLVIAKELLKTKALLAGKSVENLINLPEMTERTELAIMRIISGMASSAYKAAPEIFPLLSLNGLRLSVKFGHNEFSPYLFAGYGIIQCGVLGEVASGYDWGRLALRLLDKLDIRETKSRTMYVVWLFINHWKVPLKDCLDPFLQAYQTGLEIGDLEFAALSIYSYAKTQLYVRTKLSKVDEELAKYSEAIENLNQHTILNYILIIRQFVLNLRGDSSDPCRLLGTAYHANEMMPIHHRTNDDNALLLIYGALLNLNYLFENDNEAKRNADLARPISDTQVSHPSVPTIDFYDSLTRLALIRKENRSGQSRFFRRIIKNQRKMRKAARHCSANYGAKYHLVEAEIARVQNKKIKVAIDHYNQAIGIAKANRCREEEALALKLTAKFWLEQDNPIAASAYMKLAHQTYLKWGALAVAGHIEEKYGRLLQWDGQKEDITPTTSTKTKTSSKTLYLSKEIDVSTVVKASHTISREIDLGQLLKEIMRFCIKNTGADRALLIIKKQEDERFYIEAKVEGDSEIDVLQSIPLKDFPHVSSEIVRYVSTTGETVVLHNACKEGDYTDDSHIQENQTKSLLCAPITNKGRTSGVIYLENNLTSNTFTDERLQLLGILAAQAAISIENALLLVHREEAAKLHKEMEIAENIQTGLLPQNPTIEGFEIDAYMSPADEVGGDYYDVINEGGHDWLVIGDVSGHGVPAGLIMMMAHTSIHTVLTQHPDITPSELLAVVDSVIKQNIKRLEEHKYMTITVFAVDKKGELTFAGLHQDIMVFRRKTSSVERVQTTGMWIGIMDSDSGMFPNGNLTLERGDAILVYTDGITEACKKKSTPVSKRGGREMFGEQRLASIFKGCGEQPIQEIKTQILRELEDYETKDDVTLVVMRKV